MLKSIMVFLAVILFQVNITHAQGVEPPRTSGEGDVIIQEIAQQRSGPSPSGGLGQASASGVGAQNNQDIVLAPVTGGVIPEGRDRQSTSIRYQAANNAVVETFPVVAVSSITVGVLLVSIGFVIQRRQHGQRRQRR